MRIAVLGPVLIDGRPVRSLRSRRVVAALASAAGNQISTAQLIDALWGESPPATAAKSLQNVIVELRRTLGPGAIVTTPVGYRLGLPDDEVDIARFESSPPDVALALWRGTPLVELDDWLPAIGVRVRLVERRAAMLETHLAAQIDRGSVEDAVGELRDLVACEPYRESAWELLVVALYRSGRQADALRTLHEQRRLVRDQLGLEPSPRLRDLELDVLNHNQSLATRRTGGRIPRSLAAERDERWPLAGRHRELVRLHQAWTATLAGRNDPVAIVGTAGVGKTRLTAELATNAIVDEAVVVRVAYNETDSSYSSLAESIRSWARDTHDEVRLPAALGLVVPDLVRAPTSLAADDPTIIFDAVTSWLSRVAELNPVIFILDDVHWATRANATMIQQVVRRLADVRALVVLAGRPSAATRELVTACHASVVELGELDEPAMLVMLNSVVDEPDARDVWRRSGGNPFLASAAATHMAEHGLLELPSGTAWSLDLMVSQLGPAGAEVLTSAALAGVEFGLEPVAAASGVPVEETVAVLNAAVTAGLLAECAGERWRFRHDLVRTWQLERLTATTRSHNHASVASALERFEPEGVAAIAHHYELAGPNFAAKAQQALIVAGDEAMAVGAVADALDCFRRAGSVGATSAALAVRIAAALAALADPGWLRAALDAGTSANAEGDTQSLISAALVTPQWTDGTGGLDIHPARVDLIRRALAVSCRPIDDALLLAALADEHRFDPDGQSRAEICRSSIDRLDSALADRDAISDGAVARVLSTVAESYGPAHVAERHVLVQRLQVLAEHSDDPSIRSRASWAEVSMAIQQADRPLAERSIERLEALVRDEHTEARQWSLTMLQGTIAVADGRFAEGERLLNESLQVGLTAGKPDALMLYGVCLMTLRIMQDRVAELMALLEPSFDTPAGRSIAPMMHALLGDEARASELLDRFIAEGGVGMIGDRAVSMALLRCWSSAAFYADHVPAAEQLYWEIAPLAGYLGHEGPVTAAADEYLGMLAMTIGRWDEAERWLLSAETLAERFGARLLVLSARYYQLELRARRTDRPAGTAELNRAFAEIERELEEMGALLIVRRRERREARSSIASAGHGGVQPV